jgi:hypothetical protein
MEKEKRVTKEKFVKYGGIYTQWVREEKIANACTQTHMNNSNYTKNGDGLKNNTNNIKARSSHECEDRVLTCNVNNVKNKENSRPKINLVDQITRQIINKDIYSKFVAIKTDHDIMCFIKPYMNSNGPLCKHKGLCKDTYSCYLPKINGETCHQLVLSRIRNGHMKSIKDCPHGFRLGRTRGDSKLMDMTQCYVCDQPGTVYDTFCVSYRKYHEHVPLCIRCGGNLEQKGNVLFDRLGKASYNEFIKQVCYFRQHLPIDVVKIITHYVYMIMDKVCIRY